MKQLVTVLPSLSHLAHLLLSLRTSKTPVSHKNKELQDFITKEIEENIETSLAFLYNAWLGGGGDIGKVEKQVTSRNKETLGRVKCGMR